MHGDGSVSDGGTVNPMSLLACAVFKSCKGVGTGMGNMGCDPRFEYCYGRGPTLQPPPQPKLQCDKWDDDGLDWDDNLPPPYIKYPKPPYQYPPSSGLPGSNPFFRNNPNQGQQYKYPPANY